MNDEDSQIRQINNSLKLAIAPNFSRIKQVVASTSDELDNIIGIFSDSKNNYYSFTITPSDQLSYSRLSLTNQNSNNYLDSYSEGVRYIERSVLNLSQNLLKSTIVVPVTEGNYGKFKFRWRYGAVNY